MTHHTFLRYDFYNILEEQFVYYNQYIVATADNFASISTQVGVQMATKNFVLADLVEKSAMAGATGVSWMSMLQMYKSTPDCVAADVATMFSTNVLDGYEKLDYCTLVNVSSLDISEAFAGEAASQSSSSFTETSYVTTLTRTQQTYAHTYTRTYTYRHLIHPAHFEFGGGGH